MLSALHFSVFLVSSFTEHFLFISFQQENEIKKGNTLMDFKYLLFCSSIETGIPKTGTRDPSGALLKPENRDHSGTLQKPENRYPCGPYINPTCCKNVLRKQRGSWVSIFKCFFKSIARS